jgi:SAM-dependent methyltransferase
MMVKATDCPRRPCRLCGAEDYTPVYYLDEVEIVRCQGCGLIQIASLASLEDLKRYYAQAGLEPSHHRSAFDNRKIRRASRFRVGYLKKYTGLRSGKILEVGSAYGHFLSLLKERGFEVLGVEPSAEGARQHRKKGLPVINDLLEKAGLPEAHFDAICMFQVFEHFEEPREAARILHAKLKPGGYLIIEVPDIFSIGAKFEKNPFNLFKMEHLSYFSPETLNAMLTGAGFSRLVARHYDYDALRIPCGKSLKKIFLPLVTPHFPGLLDRILTKELEIHGRPGPQGPGSAPGPPPREQSGGGLKTMRKNLTAPLDICCGYLAYLLDRGASLFWIGKKV